MNAGASADAGQAGPPLLELVDVTKHYRGSGLWSRADAAVRAVSGVSLAVPAGTSVGIVGESAWRSRPRVTSGCGARRSLPWDGATAGRPGTRSR
jgi:ABC-type microcin C transport system duplicated ATPase subunit YejF